VGRRRAWGQSDRGRRILTVAKNQQRPEPLFRVRIPEFKHELRTGSPCRAGGTERSRDILVRGVSPNAVEGHTYRAASFVRIIAGRHHTVHWASRDHQKRQTPLTSTTARPQRR